MLSKSDEEKNEGTMALDSFSICIVKFLKIEEAGNGMKNQFKELSSSKKTVHIYYASEKQEHYLENLSAYIAWRELNKETILF